MDINKGPLVRADENIKKFSCAWELFFKKFLKATGSQGFQPRTPDKGAFLGKRPLTPKNFRTGVSQCVGVWELFLKKFLNYR